ncbi:MAG: hypothetical protein EWV79_17495 [Microcystis aeruginosa Ma_MB_S_20031200_S102D]|nr:MAG: hypothetical protein EWV79_17495 [Microcystis aeruginosa Ma_MB_S_20031200_S102D]
MIGKIRKLNDEGIKRFAEFLNAGASGDTPLHLLTNPETSDPFVSAPILGSADFKDRFEFGVYIRTLFKGMDASVIGADRHLWTTLALFWFDRLCPKKSDGSRDVGEDYRYVLSADYRHYYRHLVRSPWYLAYLHGENARILLVAPREQNHPLSVHGEILEQFGGRQQVLASRPIVAAANRMYLDPVTKRPRKGVAGSGRGSARRFGIVLRQLELTYDPEVMAEDGLQKILPAEFEKWTIQSSNKGSASKKENAQTAAVVGI